MWTLQVCARVLFGRVWVLYQFFTLFFHFSVISCFADCVFEQSKR